MLLTQQHTFHKHYPALTGQAALLQTCLYLLQLGKQAYSRQRPVILQVRRLHTTIPAQQCEFHTQKSSAANHRHDMRNVRAWRTSTCDMVVAAHLETCQTLDTRLHTAVQIYTPTAASNHVK
jgi:hypothetical protein